MVTVLSVESGPRNRSIGRDDIARQLVEQARWNRVATIPARGVAEASNLVTIAWNFVADVAGGVWLVGLACLTARLYPMARGSTGPQLRLLAFAQVTHRSQLIRQGAKVGGHKIRSFLEKLGLALGGGYRETCAVGGLGGRNPS